MKKIKYISIVQICLSTLIFTSCTDWFEVRPTSQILVSEQFSTEKGFKDQLIGVYTTLAETSLYGRELTYGFAEALTQNYDLSSSSHSYYEVAQYNYQESTVKNRYTNIWLNAYNAIANLNLMLEYIDKVDATIFSNTNYLQYKAEALGLRAFIHFDLLRLFAPSFAVGPKEKAIPYVTKYSTKITPTSTVEQVVELILEDLISARALYDEAIAFQTAAMPVSYRSTSFISGTLARVYQWKGDFLNARNSISLIFEENSDVYWTHYSIMESPNSIEWDRTFSSEGLFVLSINNMDKQTNSYIGPSASANNLLNVSDEKMDQIFEVTAKGYGGDWRYLRNFQYDGANRYFYKYRQEEGARYRNRISLIKKGEMALIIAESYLDEGNLPKAIEYLNLLRDNRGSIKNYPLSSDLTASQVAEELYKEYRKETLGEGQLFYFYKRKQYETIPGSDKSATGIYVIPLPENEIEFGNR